MMRTQPKSEVVVLQRAHSPDQERGEWHVSARMGEHKKGYTELSHYRRRRGGSPPHQNQWDGSKRNSARERNMCHIAPRGSDKTVRLPPLAARTVWQRTAELTRSWICRVRVQQPAAMRFWGEGGGRRRTAAHAVNRRAAETHPLSAHESSTEPCATWLCTWY